MGDRTDIKYKARKILPDSDFSYIGSSFRHFLAAVVNSHQSRFPRSEHLWVQQTLKAVRYLKEKDAALLTSVGLNSYELPVWYAGSLGLNQIVVLPVRKNAVPEKECRKILKDFDLDENRTAFLVFTSTGMRNKSLDRDRLILSLAERIYPVSIRNRGHMNAFLSETDSSNISNRFSVTFENFSFKFPQPHVTNPDIPKTQWNYLTHWTRRTSIPFPGENRADYYRSVMETTGEYSHSALHAMIHILACGKIKASSQSIRGGFKMVSFTAAHPKIAVKSMTWNSPRIRFNFEPHGIAVNRQILMQMGARPVIYGNPDQYVDLSGADRPFFQSPGKGRQWAAEHEWRIKGDLILAQIPKKSIIILTDSFHNALRVKQKFPGYNVVSLV